MQISFYYRSLTSDQHSSLASDQIYVITANEGFKFLNLS